jgi:8-oxo-dGTP diphosphatase
MAAERPRVGVAAIVRRDGKVLLGRRIGSHGARTWNFPGGHLEFGETPEACAERETLEECGLRASARRRLGYTNDLFAAEGRHYITLYIEVEAPDGEPRILEPAKCTAWRWFDLDSLPEPLFLPIQNLLKSGSLQHLLRD